jgi:hypothetical protein
MKKEVWWIIIFAVVLVMFSLFSTKIHFHDTLEYITIAKHFAGIKNVNLFSGHSLVYPAFISIFLKIWASFSMIKLVNALWLFLISLTMVFWLKNKKAFILFVFSPLLWHMSIQTAPVLPASFFFLLSFIFFQKKKIRYNLTYSGIFLGLACAFYTPMLLISFFFILVYFWKKDFSEFFKYAVFLFIGFLPRILLDWYLFNNPLYSLIRYGGDNFIITLGLHPGINPLNIFANLEVFLIVVAISPFLFRLHRLDFKKYKKVIVFLIITSLIFIARVPRIKYFIIIAPIIIILLSKILTNKEIKWHCIISLFLIVSLTFSYFSITDNMKIKQDLDNLHQQYDVDYIIGGPYESLKFAMLSWKNKPYFVWYQDFKTGLENKTTIRGYEFVTESKIPLKSRLRICGYFDRFENKTYENYIIVTDKTPEEFKDLRNYSLDRCYEKLCVYKK